VTLAYQSGFGSEFATEALAGALPTGRNSPQRAPYGLYAEQLSGTAFTAPRHANRRTWLYRIRPAVLHGEFGELAHPALSTAPFAMLATSPNQLRWDPFPLPDAPTDFVDGLVTIAGNGDAAAQCGIAIHVYACNRAMQDRFFYDADGELLIVPQLGTLHRRENPVNVKQRHRPVDLPARLRRCHLFHQPLLLDFRQVGIAQNGLELIFQPPLFLTEAPAFRQGVAKRRGNRSDLGTGQPEMPLHVRVVPPGRPSRAIDILSRQEPHNAQRHCQAGELTERRQPLR